MDNRTFDDFDAYAKNYRDIHSQNIKLSGADSFYFAEQRVKMLQAYEKNGSLKVEIIVIAAIIFGFYKAFSAKESIFYHISGITSQQGLSSKLKALIDAISFYDTLWLQGLIQLFLLWAIKWSLRSRGWSLLKKIVVADMIIACLLNVPFTGAGKASVATIQQVINRSPAGIPIPQLTPINKNDTAGAEEKAMIGDWSFYNKQPGTVSEAAYPIVLKNMKTYFEGKVNYIDKAFVFAADTSGSKISMLSYSPQKIELAVNNNSAGKLVLQQNFYPHWYFINGTVKQEVQQYDVNFMSAPLGKGKNTITFSFEPTKVKVAMLISLITFLILLLILFFSFSQKSKVRQDV